MDIIGSSFYIVWLSYSIEPFIFLFYKAKGGEV
jgi:hypothetical protein